MIDCREADEHAAGRDPGRGVDPARLPRAADREARRPIATRRSSCTARAATARCSRAQRSPSSATRTCGRSPAGSPAGSAPASRGSTPHVAAPGSGDALLAPHAAARGRRRRPAASCSPRRSCASAPAGSARRRRMYLAAAGVGTLGMIDDDVVDASNLQRQILHGTDRARHRRRSTAPRRTLKSLNPDVTRRQAPRRG